VVPIEVVVTFERMDPIALSAAKLSREPQHRRVWLTNLADFLMVRDVLGDPAAFLHYAETRGRTNEAGVDIYVESDALGGYLVDRLRSVLGQGIDAEGQDVSVVLGYSSAALNEYFTMNELGVAADCPQTGVPVSVSEALRFFGADRSPAWWTVASGVMSLDEGGWRRWRRFVRRHKGERRFLLPGESSAVVVSSSAATPQLRVGALIDLVIPRASLV